MTKDEICGLLRQIHDVLAMQSETNHWAKPTPAEYAMGYAEGFNDACKPNYTALPQRTWVGLTDEEVERIKLDGRDLEFVSMTALHRFARDIQAKLKEKNT
jgi:sulfite reductase beta subunit-like hemoprotein